MKLPQYQLSRINRNRYEKRLKASFDHGVCKRSVVVTVREVPPKIPFSKWGTLIVRRKCPHCQGEVLVLRLSNSTYYNKGLGKRRYGYLLVGLPLPCPFCNSKNWYPDKFSPL